VDENNCWWLLSKQLTPFEHKAAYKKYGKRVFLTAGEPYLKSINFLNIIKTEAKIDVCVPCFHGVNGEDGSVSGVLQLSNIPFTCGNTFALGASMDKIATKTILRGIGARVLPCVLVKNKTEKIKKSIKKMGYPVIVKPANLGSSIGIAACNNEEELDIALDIAFSFDNRVMVERCLTDFYEVNCSALRLNGKVEIGEIERPLNRDKILTFADKYANGGKTMEGGRIIPYDFEYSSYIKIWTKRIYNAFNFDGIIRVDFLVNNASNDIYVNEVNAIPGSLAYYLWKNKYTHQQLLENLIQEALKRQTKKDALNYAYKSDILNNSMGSKSEEF
jgi:D-alanine-D-alanine ligase